MKEDESKFSYYNEFFKVYLSHLSSTEMVIPPAFMVLMEMNQLTMPKNAALKDFNGKIWNVVLEREKDYWIIKDGWKDFASYHSLVDGDFLIFKYDGTSHFDVELYGFNGLKKGKYKENRNFVNKKVQLQKEPVGIQTAGPTGSAGGRGCKPSGTLAAVARTPFFVEQVKEEPIAEEEPAGPSGCAGGSGTKPSRILPAVARTPVSVKRNKPCFVWTMTETKRYVNVPILVLKAHGIKIPRVMQLRDEKKKLWPVRTSFLDNGQIRLTSGWMEFCRKKKLEVGDQCVLEFILEKDNVSYVIEVQVLRRRSGARSVKHGSFGGNSSKLSENNETGLAVALKRNHSARKTNRRGQNISKEGTSTGWEWCEDQAERMEPEVRNDETSGLDKANAFKSENPCFRIVMQPTHIPPRPVLCIPITFSREYIPERKVDIILSLPDGLTWNCGLSIEENNGYSRARVATGWTAFARHNHLKIRDTCIFELIDIEEIVFKVHIFRSAGGSDSR